MDPEGASVEVWALAGQEAPETVRPGGFLRWTPVVDIPSLEIDVTKLFSTLGP